MSTLLRFTAAVVVILLGPVASAQRHSGETEQGYFNKPSNPILNIDDVGTKKWMYFRLSELKQKPRTLLEAPDPRTGRVASFVGVSLDDLVPAGLTRSFDFCTSTLFKNRVALTSTDLDSTARPLVAYSENGKPLGLHPFWIIAHTRQGRLIVLSTMDFIRVGTQTSMNR